MTLTLHLPPELEQRLTQEATRHGLALDTYTLQLLDQSLPPPDRRTELVTLLQSWLDAQRAGGTGALGDGGSDGP